MTETNSADEAADSAPDDAGIDISDHQDSAAAPDDTQDMEPVMVVLGFRTDEPDKLMEILARYVVLSRGQPGCRNIDYVASVTDPGRLMIVEKWASVETQRAHFDSPEMVEMATNTVPLLNAQPDIDLFEGISMHDLN